MGKRGVRLWALLLVVPLLCACNPLDGKNIDDLLRAPVLGEGQGEVQQALADQLGEEPQYIYPKQGSWLNPLIRADLDGDGTEEGVLLYTLGGSNARVAVLENAEGGWQLRDTYESPLPDVADFEVADLLGNDGQQLIVGFASANLANKMFMLFQYSEGKLIQVHSTNYSLYEMADFTGRGGRELIIVSAEEQTGGMELQYIPVVGGAFQNYQTVQLLDDFKSCVGLTPGDAPQAQRMVLVVDGILQANDMLASQLVYYSNGQFYTVPEEAKQMLSETARDSRLLRSRDIDRDGQVEIPRRVGEPVHTKRGDMRLELVEWMDFISEADKPARKEFGLLDGERQLYFQLPDGWHQSIRVEDGPAEGHWQIRDRSEDVVLAVITTLEDGDPAPENAIKVPTEGSVYLVPGEDVSEAQWNQVRVVSLRM